jgi:signal transduction histidine kinase
VIAAAGISQTLAPFDPIAERVAVLAAVSRKLAASLDYAETLHTATRACVPEVADWCLLGMLEETPGRGQILLWHRQPELAAAGQWHLQRHGFDFGSQQGAAQVIRTGAPAWTTPETAIISSAPQADRLMAEQLGHGTGLCVPIEVGGRPCGALTLVRAETRDPFEPEDLDFALELGARIGLAVQSARRYREAQLAIVARDEFLSVAAHELNTPLTTLRLELQTAISLVSESLQAGGGARECPGSSRLDRCLRQIDRLSRLVGSLLDAARASSPGLALDLSPLDLAQMAAEVAEQFGPELGRAGCSLRVCAPEPVVGRWDAVRISQVISNLLSNACKYGAGKSIELAVERLEDRARLTVTDHGIGISAADSDRIFEPFERAVSLRSYEGLGLGLYITRRVVAAHGGTIEVKSEVGQGSTFVVELPLSLAPR